MKIVRSTPADVGLIMDLYDAATAYQKTVALKAWQGFDPAIVVEAIASGRQWNIVENEQIACVFTLTYEDELIWKEKNADAAIYIHRIATNPAFRGKNYVKHIVAWAKTFARCYHKDFIRMDTGSGNDKLNQYYVSCGFNYLGITEMGEAEGLPAHYKNGSFSLFEMAVPMRVALAATPEDIAKCTRVLLELRPHISPDALVPMVQKMLGEGYQLAYIEEDGIAVAAVGFRYLQFLFCGKHFYIDDLSTLPDKRGQGHGGILLDYVAMLAQEAGYPCITLDSGFSRHTAHRLYLNKGFDVVALHFNKTLGF